MSETAEAFAPAIEQIRTLHGLVDAYFLVERDGLLGLSVTIWDSVDAMERSRVAVSRARAEAAERAGAEVASTYELDVRGHARGLAMQEPYQGAATR